jgi:hypothetical protein
MKHGFSLAQRWSGRIGSSFSPIINGLATLSKARIRRRSLTRPHPAGRMHIEFAGVILLARHSSKVSACVWKPKPKGNDATHDKNGAQRR